MSNATLDQMTLSWMIRDPSRPRTAGEEVEVRHPVPVELHISTVEPLRPTCWAYMGV